MADNKKYYYLKVKDSFFDDDIILYLENFDKGYEYTIILIKMYLRSLKGEGKLMFNDRIAYTPQTLSKIIRHDAKIIEEAIKVFEDLDLITIMSDGAIYMNDIQNFIGESSTAADRQREYYSKIKEEKNVCKKSNKKSCKKSDKKSTPEIEIEKEIKIETELEQEIETETELILYPNTNTQLNKEINNLSIKTAARISDKVLTNEFEEIWKLYPKKKSKKTALSHYMRARRHGTKEEDVMNGVVAYLDYIHEEKIDPQYIKHGSTWFNQECWNDDYSLRRKKTLKDISYSDIDRLIALEEERERNEKGIIS